MKKLLTVFAVALVLVLAIAGVASAKEATSNGVAVAWGQLDEITKVDGHNVDPASVKIVKEPTCTKTGLADFRCIDKPDEWHTVVIAALGHDWASSHHDGILEWGNIIKKPTCTEFGKGVDVCLRCKITGETRVIDKLMHKYDATTYTEKTYVKLPNGDKWLGYFTEGGTDKGKHFQVITMPTCATEGDAYRCCIICGTPDKEFKVSLRTIAHDYTKWETRVAPTCWSEGVVNRVCVVCGKLQYLTMELGESARADYNKLVAKRNPNFATEYTRSATLFEPIAKNPDNKKFWDVLKTGGAEWERLRSEDWINTCYSHTDVYVCPYCHCDTVAFPKTPHRKVLHINMKLHSHVWKSTPEDNKSNITGKTWIEDGGDPNTGTWKKAVDEARLQWAWDNQASVPATCLYEGFKLYMCKYDCELDDAWDQRHDGPEADPYRYKVRRTPALGHNFTDWELWQTFEKDGKPVYQFERHCTQCGETQTKVTYDESGKNPVEVVKTVKLNKKSITLKKDETFQITYTIKPAAAVAEKITYKSDKKSVAKVSSTGLVTAKKKGTATITVTIDGVSATLKVKVK